ncbi:DUF7560 family zinc ribbon protein [Natronolimnobius baerhuensis]|nr:transcriptional regulator [Natronolimnobius baerhuensis]
MSPYHFRCPECVQQLTLERPERVATLESGCPFCGTPISPADFATA